MMRPVLLLAVASLASHPATAATLRVVGSDLLGGSFRDALQTRAEAGGWALALDLRGSAPGAEALATGRADVALLAAADTGVGGTEALADCRRLPVAWLAAIVVVSAENPLTHLTYEQLAGVFGSEAVQTLRVWGDLGLSADWTARSISPVALAREKSLALDFFAHAILPERRMTAALTQAASIPEALEIVSNNRGALVLLPVVPEGAAGARVRALPVVRRAGEVAFGPSGESIETGDYPLRLPLELVFRPGREAAVAPLVRFLVSPEGVAAVRDSLLIPLPAGARGRLAAEFRAQ